MQELKPIILIIFVLLANHSICQRIDWGELKVIEFSSTDCENDISSYQIQKRIIRQELVNDTLIVEVSICAYCESNLIGVAIYRNDTLYLDSGSQIIKEVDNNGETIEYLEKGAECYCDYILTYKILTENNFKYVKYDQEFLYFHGNHLRPDYKIHKDDTLLLFEDCYEDCYYRNTKEYFIKYCYYESGEIESIIQYYNHTDLSIITIYNEEGDKEAVIWKNENNYPEFVIEWNDKYEIKTDTLESFKDIEESKYFKYLNTF